MATMILARVARGVTEHFPARASEWALAGMMMIWGIIVLQPGDLFAKMPAYAYMHWIAPEQAWGMATISVGAVRLMALVINGTFLDTWWGKWSPWVRCILSFASCFLWFAISFGLIGSHVLSTGLATYPFLFALDAWNCRRAAGDAGSMVGDLRRGST